MLPAEVADGGVPLLVSALIRATGVLSIVSVVPRFPLFLMCAFSCVQFKMAPRQSVEVLFGAPKYRKAAVGLREKIHMLEKLHSGMSSSAVGC